MGLQLGVKQEQYPDKFSLDVPTDVHGDVVDNMAGEAPMYKVQPIPKNQADSLYSVDASKMLANLKLTPAPKFPCPPK